MFSFGFKFGSLFAHLFGKSFLSFLLLQSLSGGLLLGLPLSLCQSSQSLGLKDGKSVGFFLLSSFLLESSLLPGSGLLLQH